MQMGTCMKVHFEDIGVLDQKLSEIYKLKHNDRYRGTILLK